MSEKIKLAKNIGKKIENVKEGKQVLPGETIDAKYVTTPDGKIFGAFMLVSRVTKYIPKKPVPPEDAPTESDKFPFEGAKPVKPTKPVMKNPVKEKKVEKVEKEVKKSRAGKPEKKVEKKPVKRVRKKSKRAKKDIS